MGAPSSGPVRISVLLPTRNRLGLAKEAIETVRRQSYPHWELVVSDNCSDEDVRGHVASLADERIVYLRSDTFLPVTANWNRAIDAATGDYVVMLGDDDGLVPGYFERVLEVLETLGTPELLYHGAYHFTYPGALADHPGSRLSDETSRACFLAGRAAPALLPAAEAQTAARQALAMEMVYGFNMQYFLFSRGFLERLRGYGAVFQGPFPDFYAANMTMLLGERIGLVPEPLVIIGISPKSYGFFHFNKKEEGGLNFLNNRDAIAEVPEELRRRLLPGTNMNTSWLASVALVERYLGERFGLVLDVARYRKKQIFHVAREGGLGELWPLLTLSERGFALLAFCLLKGLGPWRAGGLALIRRLQGRGTHHRPEAVACPYQTMLEVFEGLRR